MSRTRRWAWILLVCLVLLPALCPPAGAAGPEEVEAAQAEALDLDGLRRAAEGELSGLEIGSGLDLDYGIEQIFDKGRDELPGALRRAVRSAVVLLTVVLLCALAGEVSGSLGAPAELDVTALAGALAVTAASVADIHALIGLGREALDRMSQFSKVLLPTMTAAAAAAGAPSGAAARQLATMLFSDVLLTLINSLLLPLVYL